jgi:hypothetical protein
MNVIDYLPFSFVAVGNWFLILNSNIDFTNEHIYLKVSDGTKNPHSKSM